MGCLIFVRFLQVTAELLIGAEGRAFIVHLTPNHYLLYGLAANPGSVRPTAPGHGRRRGPVPSTHLQKPSCPEPLPRIRKRHAPWPDEPLIPAHLDRERNRRWAEHCGIVKQKGTCLVHCSTMELRTHVCRVKRELRPPMNGVLPGLGSAITYWEGDYFFLTRYLI